MQCFYEFWILSSVLALCIWFYLVPVGVFKIKLRLILICANYRWRRFYLTIHPTINNLLWSLCWILHSNNMVAGFPFLQWMRYVGLILEIFYLLCIDKIELKCKLCRESWASICCRKDCRVLPLVVEACVDHSLISPSYILASHHLASHLTSPLSPSTTHLLLNLHYLVNEP